MKEAVARARLSLLGVATAVLADMVETRFVLRGGRNAKGGARLGQLACAAKPY